MGDSAVLTGKLGFIGLADLFQMLGSNKTTGVLHLRSPYSSVPGFIYFVDGRLVNAAVGSCYGLDAVHRLFGWNEGTFALVEEKVQAEHKIKKGLMQIVLDATRMLDEGLIESPGASAGKAQRKGERQEAGKVIRGPMPDYTDIIDEEDFVKGQKIVREGGHGSWIWVILDGTVKVTKRAGDEDIDIAYLGEGSFIGTLAPFTKSENKRSATVTALGDVQLGVLDAARLSREYSSLSGDFKVMLQSLDARVKRMTYRGTELVLKGYPALKKIKGKQFNIDASSPELFVVREGKLYMIGEGPNGKFLLLRLEAGEVCGHVPFVNLGPETGLTTLVASKDLKTQKLDVQALQDQYEQLSKTFKNLVNTLSGWQASTLRMICRGRFGTSA